MALASVRQHLHERAIVLACSKISSLRFLKISTRAFLKKSEKSMMKSRWNKGGKANLALLEMIEHSAVPEGDKPEDAHNSNLKTLGGCDLDQFRRALKRNLDADGKISSARSLPFFTNPSDFYHI